MRPHTVGPEIYNSIIVLCPIEMNSEKCHFVWFSLKKKKKKMCPDNYFPLVIGSYWSILQY